MKKIMIIVTVSLFLSNITYAQGPRLGFTGGTTFSNFKGKASGNSTTGNIKTGLTLGMIVNVPVGKKFAIQPGIHWVQKGTKDKETVGNVSYKTTLSNNYMEIRGDLLYYYSKFFIGAGPSVALAMAGKWKTESGGQKKTEDVMFGNKEKDDMRELDFGLDILAGYQLPGGVVFSVTFNQGLNNLVTRNTDNTELKSYYFGIRLGYLIKARNY